jgi:hypothetical protein
VVLPPSDADVATSTIVLANPGTEDAVVTLEVLPPGGGAAVSDTVTIPAGTVAQWDPDLLGSAAGAAVLVRCEAGLVVALGAAASGGGPDEPAGYALSMGVGIPA